MGLKGIELIPKTPVTEPDRGEYDAWELSMYWARGEYMSYTQKKIFLPFFTFLGSAQAEITTGGV